MSNTQAEAAAKLANKTILTHLKEWQELTEWMSTAKARELELREELAEAFIPTESRKEGVNRIVVGDIEITVDHKINRTLDEAALEAIMPQLPEAFRTLGVLIEYKPRLVMDGLRALAVDPTNYLTFSQALTERVGTPALSIKPVKETEAVPVAVAQKEHFARQGKKHSPKTKATKGRK